MVNIEYKDTRIFNSNELERLFCSVELSSGHEFTYCKED